MDVKPLFAFHPGRRFPAYTVTGGECALECRHCDHRWLEGMADAKKPEELWKKAQGLAANNGIGFLLSGGCDASGSVPLESYLPTIQRILCKTDLIVNVHTGIVTENVAKQLGEIGVKVVSADVVGSNETVRNVMGIDRKASDFSDGIKLLLDAGIEHIVPHICVGLDHGKIVGELEALAAIKEIFEPKALVLISLIPTRRTAMEHVDPPSPRDLGKVVAEARRLFPETFLLLGCMRNRTTPGLEEEAVNAGIDGIVNPSAACLDWVRDQGREVVKRDGCCALAGLDQA